MPPLRRLLRALLLACALAPTRARAQAELVVDNDLFGLRGARDAPPDYDYTHGTSVRWNGGSRLAARVLGGPACAGPETGAWAHQVPFEC